MRPEVVRRSTRSAGRRRVSGIRGETSLGERLKPLDEDAQVRGSRAGHQMKARRWRDCTEPRCRGQRSQPDYRWRLTRPGSPDPPEMISGRTPIGRAENPNDGFRASVNYREPWTSPMKSDRGTSAHDHPVDQHDDDRANHGHDDALDVYPGDVGDLQH